MRRGPWRAAGGVGVAALALLGVASRQWTSPDVLQQPQQQLWDFPYGGAPGESVLPSPTSRAPPAPPSALSRAPGRSLPPHLRTGGACGSFSCERLPCRAAVCRDGALPLLVSVWRLPVPIPAAAVPRFDVDAVPGCALLLCGCLRPRTHTARMLCSRRPVPVRVPCVSGAVSAQRVPQQFCPCPAPRPQTHALAHRGFLLSAACHTRACALALTLCHARLPRRCSAFCPGSDWW